VFVEKPQCPDEINDAIAQVVALCKEEWGKDSLGRIGMTQERIDDITSGKYESSGGGYRIKTKPEDSVSWFVVSPFCK